MAHKASTNSGNFEQSVKKLELAKDENKSAEFLYDYFFNTHRFNGKFLDYLVDNHPEQFIDAVRKSQAYLRVAKLKQLIHLEGCSNTSVSNYIKVFKAISQEEQRLYADIKGILKVFDQTNPVAVLNVVCFWFESKRAEIFASNCTGEIIYDITPKIETVNFFLTHYFKAVETEIELHSASTSSIAQYTLDVLASNFTRHPTWLALELIDNYLFYLKGTIEIFSYDPNYVLSVSGNTATLSFQDIKLREKWNEEEAKILESYNTLKQQAELKSLTTLDLTAHYLENNPDPSILVEFNSRAKENLSLAAAEDYYLVNSVLGGVPTNLLIDYLNQNILESYHSYIFPMDLQNAANPAFWIDHLKNNVLELEQTDRGGCPLIILGQEMVEKVKDFYSLDMKTAMKLVELISNDISSYEYADRFNPKINLLGKPFIKVGKTFIGFRPISGEAVNHLSALINIMHCNHELHQIDGKEEVHVMERSIMQMFNAAGFKNTDCSVQIIDDGKIKGEFDLLIYENGVLLIAEVKRSKPRVLPSDVNNELLNSINVASQQLDERIKYITENFENFKIRYCTKLNLTETNFNDLNVIPIVISTSLEQDHIYIQDKHLKISLFELKEVLSNFRHSSNINNLKFLYDAFVTNEFWKAKDLQYEKPDITDRMLRFEL